MSHLALGALIRAEVGVPPVLHYCCRDRNLLGFRLWFRFRLGRVEQRRFRFERNGRGIRFEGLGLPLPDPARPFRAERVFLLPREHGDRIFGPVK